MPPLLTPHALSKLAPDEAPSKIRVKNLQTTLPLTDAWGRPATQQPVLISASISLHRPFSSSADTDSVTKGTVHYGILSKAILKACKEFEEIVGFGDEEGLKVPMWGRAVVCWLHYCLTGHDVLPKIPHIYISSKNIKTSKTGEPIKPLLSAEDISLLEIEITLPKASLLGSGVSLKGSFLYEGNGTEGPCAFSMDLKLHDLRMAALLGVNANEKLAKQIVICGVEMEKWDRVADSWAELEEIVAKTIEESTFQTLEALATFLTTRIITYFIMPHFSHPHPPPLSSPSSSLPHNHPQIRITLSKPTAVTFADFPVVELCTDTDPSKNELADRCWKELGRVKKPPFPLQGRLDDWLMFQGFEDYKDEF